jgi:transmembrane exosortase EpsH
MRSAVFPLTYLIFMVPMPDAMAEALETASKYSSAEIANVLFHVSGTPLLRAGLVFQLPNNTIEVAQECSGIRSSWILFMTSILAANLFLKNAVAAFWACRLRHSARHFTEWISHPRDRASLRQCRATDDSQSNPPPRRASSFSSFR